jgi:RNA polymerase sporulation-specific sigma factor
MNDYELVYLIHSEHDDISIQYMYEKYKRFIWKHIHLLNISQREHDDFHQEGLCMLQKAVETFNPSKNKTFTRYFELILKRHFYQLKRKIPDYELYEHTNFCKDLTYIEEPMDLPSFQSHLEQLIFDAYFLEEKSVKQISTDYGYHPKQIYNTIFRIREKYKIML